MKAYIATLMKCRLFSGLSEDELLKIIECTHAHKHEFVPSSLVMREGDTPTELGILLSGRLTLSRMDHTANKPVSRESFAELLPGSLVGIPDVLLSKRLEYSATAVEAAELLMIPVNQLLEPCASTCGCHLRMIRNLTRTLADDVYSANARLSHLSRRSTRDKLLSYLSREAAKNGTNSFDIPLDRQSLADYLAVDRSAMSTELSKLKTEGIIDFERNHFILK
ncbi:MAG: Crp/Fnr family transcriptional regulator [Clostridiales bacterium]|nr:Crp/Fnr family transcriptional regulator [Clostridiales bacterium]